MAENLERDEMTKGILLKRLRRVEGQVRGIQKMITEDRDCVALVIQLVAVRSAIESVGAVILKNRMKRSSHKCPDAAADIDSVATAVAIWGRVHRGDQA